MRLRSLPGLAVFTLLHAQVIDFESNGLHYKTLTKGGVTVMFAYLPPHVKDYSIVQVSISNGSPVSWTVKPEDFSYRKQEGGELQATPAVTVVNSLIAKASRHDVIKLVTTYENQLYGNIKMQSSNGYERRREDALAVGMPLRLKAGAAAAAIALVSTKLNSGESTDGAVFFSNNGKAFGPGTMLVHTGGELFEFPTEGEPIALK
ncbi:MAG TPA: hypothetical protein VGP62_01085 [Bryobacteraceae bacterium]|jgi:hypothetical protein|nr:hypothetical protein [Bryobacteraceae bacterium]